MYQFDCPCYWSLLGPLIFIPSWAPWGCDSVMSESPSAGGLKKASIARSQEGINSQGQYDLYIIRIRMHPYASICLHHASKCRHPIYSFAERVKKSKNYTKSHKNVLRSGPQNRSESIPNKQIWIWVNTHDICFTQI